MSRILLLLLVLLPTVAFCEDWPSWRGVRGDGSWKGPELPGKFPEKGLKTVWTQPIGGGYCGLCVAEGLLFTMDLEQPIVTRKDDQPDGTERVRCFDATTGKPIWSHSYPVKYRGLGGYNNGPRAMPTFHNGRVYTLGAVGHLNCLEAKSGKVIWSKDLVKELQAKVPEWGFAGSPIIDGERLLIHAGLPDGSLLALDAESGKERWRALSDPAGYCTPVVIETRHGKQLLLWTPENIQCVAAETGKPLWSVPYKVTYGVSIATPIFREGIVFVSGYWEGSKAIRLGEKPSERELIWEEKSLRGLMAQPLYRDGLVYLLDRSNGFTCFELKTGKKRWDDEHRLTPKGRNPHASIISLHATDRILALNSEGELILARINGDGYEELSRTKLTSTRIWSHPAFADRFLYFRTDGGEQMGKGPFELKCVQLVE